MHKMRLKAISCRGSYPMKTTTGYNIHSKQLCVPLRIFLRVGSVSSLGISKCVVFHSQGGCLAPARIRPNRKLGPRGKKKLLTSIYNCALNLDYRNGTNSHITKPDKKGSSDEGARREKRAVSWLLDDALVSGQRGCRRIGRNIRPWNSAY
jgi:hypothetical protein